MSNVEGKEGRARQRLNERRGSEANEEERSNKVNNGGEGEGEERWKQDDEDSWERTFIHTVNTQQQAS